MSSSSPRSIVIWRVSLLFLILAFFRGVMQELDLLQEDATVYKLVGHILVKQDLSEPNENVRMRLGYLADE